MNTQKAKEHLERMEYLRRGDKIDCPFCEKGKIVKKNDAVFTCDVCGKGIVCREEIAY